MIISGSRDWIYTYVAGYLGWTRDAYRYNENTFKIYMRYTIGTRFSMCQLCL